METWTTTRWELERISVQGGIEPVRLKYHQALNFNMKYNLLSCFLPDLGTVIDNWDIYFYNRMTFDTLFDTVSQKCIFI